MTPLGAESATGTGLGPSATSSATAATRSFEPRLTFRGTSVELDRNFQPRTREHEIFPVSDRGTAPPDTVPAFATLEHVRWLPRGGTPMEAEAPTPILRSGVAMSQARHGGPAFAPGMHSLTLQAPERAGGGEVSIAFMAGFTPGSWWAGPDPDRWPASTDGDGRAVDVADWNTFSTTPAWPPDGRPYFGPDSLEHIPSARRPPGDDFELGTFYEIYGDRIYARREGDTVHLNAWIVLIHGGYDRDSPYEPKVVSTDPALPPDFVPGSVRHPVLQSLGFVGSPIGFQHQVSTRLPNGQVARAPRSPLYPNYDPLSFLRAPVVAGYVRAAMAGRVYVVSYATDAHQLVEAGITDPVALVALVDAGGGTPAQRLARRRILTFHVAPGPVIERIRELRPF
jgi:hypothetical protein